jgi:PAS domain S-box-containing protein
MNTRKTPQPQDETETIAAQELLRENERVLLGARQGLGVGSYVIDLATGTWKVSPELYKIFGMDETSLHTLEGWVDLLHPNAREKCIEYHSQEESEKTRIDYKCRIVRVNDGEERWVHGLEEIEYDDKKNPVRHLGSIQDVTEHKRTEEQRLLMQATMNCVSEAIFWIDPTARFLYVNDAVCRLLGYSRDELLSLSVPDIDPNFPVEAWPAHWADLKQRGSFIFETTYRTKKGAMLQTEVTVNYLQIDGKEYKCAIAREITERKRAEETLEEMTLALTHAMPGISILNPDGRYERVNDAYVQMMGYQPDELVGAGWELTVVPDDVQKAREACQRMLSVGKADFEAQALRKDGSTFFKQVLMVKRTDAKGNFVGHHCFMRDITERKRAEKQIQRSEAFLRQVIDTDPNFIYVKDREGRFTLANKAVADAYGTTVENLMVKTDADFNANPDEVEQFHQVDLSVMDTLQEHVIPEEKMTDAAGQVRWLQTVKRPIESEDGRVNHVLGVATDITARKRAEAELRESERLFRMLAEVSPAGIFRTDVTGGCLYVNECWCRIAGMSADTAAGFGWTTTIHPDDRDRVAKEWAQAVRSRCSFMSEYRFQTAAQKITWVIGQAQPELDQLGNVVGYVGVITDITERKQAESRLRRTQYAIDHATDYIFVIGHDGHFLDVNESACHRLGYTKQELLTKSVMDIDPDFPPNAWKKFWEEFRHTKLLRLETRHRSKSGEIYPVEIVANYILHEGEELEYAFVCDITERKQAEVALQSFQDQIRQMQKMEAVGQLAGGIAHDFNNILTAILGNAQLACGKVASDHPLRPNLMRILEASDRASRLVQQILTFTHQQTISRTVMGLFSVVNEAVDLLRATLPAGVELTATFDAATPQVLADATQIHQVLMNLCTNAWHALNKQSGLIAVDLASVTLTQPLHSLFATLPPGRYACLSVRDTGCGMDTETATRIFEPFYTTKPLGQGTGLGLSLVHGIVRGHEGAIVVDSSPGQGTTIYLYFPAAEVRAFAREPVEGSPVALPGRIRHLLYLDDEVMLVELVRAWFEPRGYRVTGCTLAAEALDAVRADPAGFDVVVTDYNMPGMSGLQVAQALARIRANLPVVLVSGHLSPTAQAASLAANIKAMVSKTIMWQQLENVITRLLDTPPEA